MKGAISKKGYLNNSPDKHNDFNLVPSNRITMKGVDRPLQLIPIKLPEGQTGKSVTAYPGKEYKFPGYDAVLEIPKDMKKKGGSAYSEESQVPVLPYYNTAPYQGFDVVMAHGGSAYPVQSQLPVMQYYNAGPFPGVENIMAYGGPNLYPGQYSIQSQLPVMNGYDASPQGSASIFRRGGANKEICVPCMFEALKQQGGPVNLYNGFFPDNNQPMFGGEEYNSRHIYGPDIIGYRPDGEPVYRQFGYSPASAPGVVTPTIFGPDIIGHKPDGTPIYRQFQNSNPNRTPGTVVQGRVVPQDRFVSNPPEKSVPSKKKGYSAETAEMQKKLNSMGANLSVDGIWGPKTQAAYDKYMGQPQGNTYAARNSDYTGKVQNHGKFQMGGSNPQQMYQDSLTLYNQSVAGMNALKNSRSYQDWVNYYNANKAPEARAAYARLHQANGIAPETIYSYDRYFGLGQGGGASLFKEPVAPTGNQNPTYMGATMVNGMPQPLPAAPLQKETVQEPSLQRAYQVHQDAQKAEGKPVAEPAKPATYTAPQYQVMQAGKPLFNPDGSPVMQKGRAPLPAYLQAPNTTQAQRAAWWTANGYSADGTGTYTAPQPQNQQQPQQGQQPVLTFKQGGWIKKASDSMERRGTKGAFTEYCGGKVTSECIERGLKSSNPTTRKRAAFAKAMHSIAKKQKGGDVPAQYEGLGYLERRNAEFLDNIAGNFRMHSAMDEVSSLDKMHSQFMQSGGAAMPVGNVYSQDQYYSVGPPDYSGGYPSVDIPANPMWDLNYQVPAGAPTYDNVQMADNQLENRPITSGTNQKQRNWFLSTTADQRANAILAGGNALAGLAERRNRMKRDEEFRRRMGSDYFYGAIPGGSASRGDYDTNSGMFRPDMMTPVQFSGAAPTGYGYRSFQRGGTYYMSDNDIQQFLQSGGEVEYLD